MSKDTVDDDKWYHHTENYGCTHSDVASRY